MAWVGEAAPKSSEAVVRLKPWCVPSRTAALNKVWGIFREGTNHGMDAIRETSLENERQALQILSYSSRQYGYLLFDG